MSLFQRVASFSLVLLPSFFAVACSDEGGGTEGESSDPLTVCEDYFDAYRGIADRCLNGVDFDSEFSASEKDGFLKECRYSLELPGVSDQFAQKIGACASKIKTAACDVLFSDEDTCDISEERGSVATGAACEEGVQCASGSCNADGNTCGTCAEEVADGSACDFRATVCKEDSFCRIDDDGQGIDGVCAKRKAAGEACEDTSDECVSGTTCEGGTCKARPKLGEACTDRCAGLSFCDAGTCVELPGEGENCLGELEVCGLGLTCNEGTTKCEKRPPPDIEIGGECTDSDRCKSGFCGYGSEGNTGTCKARGKVNEACADDGSTRCETGLRCTAGKCAELAPLCK